MNNIEEHVTGLEISRKLKELGIKQNAYFSWWKWRDTFKLRGKEWESEISGEMPISAFLASELMDLLPHAPEPYRIVFGIENPGCDLPRYYGITDWKDYPHEFDAYSSNMADVIAELIIHLIESNLIKMEGE